MTENLTPRSSTRYLPGKLPAEELARLISRYTQKDPRLIISPGVGKDAAVIAFPDRYLIAKTDPITFATEEIGWYVVHVNANDVASMGGTPKWFLATLLLPQGKTGPTEVEEIFAAIARACQELDVVFCGGHTEITLGLDRPMVIGQMLGEAPKEKLVTPQKISLGDEILLTKGIAIEGTALIARERKDRLAYLGKEVIERCRHFLRNPGISVVREARTASGVAEIHAFHDPTEGGLATGLQELALAGSVGLFVEMDKIPIFPETDLLCRELRLDPLGLIASGALLIVSAAGDSKKIVAALKKEGISSAVIGKIWEEEKGVKMMKQGEMIDLPRFTRDEVARLFEEEGSGAPFVEEKNDH